MPINTHIRPRSGVFHGSGDHDERRADRPLRERLFHYGRARGRIPPPHGADNGEAASRDVPWASAACASAHSCRRSPLSDATVFAGRLQFLQQLDRNVMTLDLMSGALNIGPCVGRNAVAGGPLLSRAAGYAYGRGRFRDRLPKLQDVSMGIEGMTAHGKTVHFVRHMVNTICTAQRHTFCGMEAGDRLKRAREIRGYKTAADFARRFHIGESIHTHRENGTRGISAKAAKFYASKLKVSLDWLLTGQGSMDDQKKLVPLGGYVGTGAEVYPTDETSHGIEQIEGPPDATDDTRAYIIRGDSMYPAYSDGDAIFTNSRQRADECIGLECIVDLQDGRRMLKLLAKGSRKGHYTLMSHHAPPIQDQPIEWAYPVDWVRRAKKRHPHQATSRSGEENLPVRKATAAKG